ncbi:ABC-F family ATP-binding cassette domain-containing protein [Paenibacillus sp. M1]|uniref:ABC-F family ATP-binding cassette domain-containing protein n=1 Tax=Paenibacillus haidiansis TaxID=1574488 RepID=A0ABU7VR52_9BACL
MSILTVEQLTHTFGDKPVFREIGFRLLRGEHAGLVGGNGAGKSTLLRMLAGDLIPDAGQIGWLPGAKFGYLRQDFDLVPGTTVLETLQGAFAHLYELERRIAELAGEMAAISSRSPELSPGTDSGPDRITVLLAKYGELQDELEHSGFYRLDAKIAEVASGLGLTEIGLDRKVEQLSGGQRTKLLLGVLLLEEPQVLLLDEPTNHLDDAHIEWLTEYLKRYEQAFIVVSHDERFLNEITGAIYHLEHQRLKRYAGNYGAFLSQYEQGSRQVEEAYERQQKEIVKLERFIEKNRIRKAKQAKSREKMLERIQVIERPSAGPQPRFEFKPQTEPVPRVLEAAGLQIGYDAPMFAPRDLRIGRGDKIAVIGSNGIGKSTLLKTLLGHLRPFSGKVRIGERVQSGYYAQEQPADAQTPLEFLCALRTDLTQREIRKTLAMAGLSDQHIRQPLNRLSGGERAKARLSELMLSPANFLVLDEPTNHLDVRAKEALKEALSHYAGTILLVSHEPSFYRDWVTGVWEVERW